MHALRLPGMNYYSQADAPSSLRLMASQILLRHSGLSIILTFTIMQRHTVLVQQWFSLTLLGR